MVSKAYKGPSALSMAHRLRHRGARALALPEDHPIRSYGMGWYDDVRDWARVVGKRYGLSDRTVAGAIAALSPQVSWLDQTRFLGSFIESVLGGDHGTLPHPGFLRNRERARDILLGADPDSILGGPKVTAFFRGIMGELDSVCVDRHAATCALGYRRESLPPRWIDHIQEAYRLAGRWLRVAPRDLQALLWCHYKGTGEADAQEAPTVWESEDPSARPPGIGSRWTKTRLYYAAPEDTLPGPDDSAPQAPELRAAS